MTNCVSKGLVPQSKEVNEAGNNKEIILLSLQNNVFNWVKEVRFKVPLIPLLLQISFFKRGVCEMVNCISKELLPQSKEVNEGGNNKGFI